MVEIADLEELWALLPALPCKGLCAKSCGAILVPPPELAAVAKEVGLIPARLDSTPSGIPAIRLVVDKKGRCPMLRSGRCSIYEIRFTICRLWGCSERHPCPYGCVPERWLTDEEFAEALARAGGSTRGVEL